MTPCSLEGWHQHFRGPLVLCT